MSHAEQAVKIPVTERMVAPSPVARGAPESPPYLMAALVSLGALVLYGVTLAPTTQFWDTSEYIAAAYSLGIPTHRAIRCSRSSRTYGGCCRSPRDMRCASTCSLP